MLSNILEWGNISNYVYKLKGLEYELCAKHVEPTLLFFNEDFKVSYTLRSGNAPFDTMKEKIIIEQKPYVVIEATTERPIEFFIERLTGIRRIIELAVGVKTDILDIRFVATEYTNYIGENVYPKELELVHNNPIENSYSEMRSDNYLFNLQDLINNANLINWFNKYELLEPILELYIEDLRDKDMSLNRHFLNMIQALETYHSRMVCNGTLVEYEKRVNKILAVVPDINKKSYKSFLLDGCKYPAISLKARIYDLLLANFEIHFNTGDILHNEFPQKIADTRNYLTHYNIKKKSMALKGQALADSYIVLKRILEYYIMKELGLNCEFRIKKIKERENNFNMYKEIRAIDKKLKEEKA